MDTIVRLFYDCYMEANHKKHYKTPEGFDELSSKFIKSLDKKQSRLFQEYDTMFMGHIVDRELRIIEFILRLLTPDFCD